MNAVTPFLFDGETLVRVVNRDGDPWFVAADVCACLEIKQASHAVESLDDDEKSVSLRHTPGGMQEVPIVSEGGLYTLILRSRKATTPGTVQHRFRKWVTSEVLPAIRKTGGYGNKSVLDLPGQRHALVLIERLKKENSPTYRRALHDLLGKTMGALGLETPPWENIEQENPPPPDRLADFWRVVEDIRANGVAINHARSLGLLAISLPDLRPHLAIPIDATLRAALKQSQSPRFVATKTVNSALTGQAVKCWVFETNS